MKKYPVWLDCDTGVDDAIALMALHALEEVELIGISAVCGNALLDDTFLHSVPRIQRTRRRTASHSRKRCYA